MAVGGLRDTSQFREGWVLAEVKLPQPWHNQVGRYAPSEHKQQQYFRVCHVAGGVKVSHAVWLRTASSFTLCPLVRGSLPFASGSSNDRPITELRPRQVASRFAPKRLSSDQFPKSLCSAKCICRVVPAGRVEIRS